MTEPRAFVVAAHYALELTTPLPYENEERLPATAVCECGWRGLAAEHEQHRRDAQRAEVNGQMNGQPDPKDPPNDPV